MEDLAFILYPGLTVLDLVGPLQVMNGMCERTNKFRTVVVAKEEKLIDTDLPLKLFPSSTFQDSLNPSVVIVPGGVRATIKMMGNKEILDYLKSTAETADYICSVCTGSLILGAAGLLEGREATTHWGCYKILEKLGAKYVQKRWVQDGKFLTSAGVSAGIDMALFLVSKLTDDATARKVQLGLEYDPKPPFGGIDWQDVDRDQLLPYFLAQIQELLGDQPDLVNKFKDL
jgi:transcriptional regulator GlxA family with amidase domain